MNSSEDNILRWTCCSPIKRFYWALLVGLGLSLAGQISAVEKTYFIGNWMNVDPGTRGILALQIGQQDSQFVMHAWGACSPNPCPWGYTRVSFLSPSVSSQDVSVARAVFKTSFSI